MDTTRQNRKQLQPNHSIKRAYIHLLPESRDPDTITVSQITDHACHNRSTFYFHYNNKKERIEDLFSDALRGITDSLREPLRMHPEVPLSEISPTTTMLFNHVENNRQLFKALTRISSSPSLFDRMETLLCELFDQELQHQRRFPYYGADRCH